MDNLFKPKFVNLPYKPEEVKPVSLEAIDAYFDASPVRVLYGGIQSNIREKEETIVYEAAANIGVDVDKEKLLHALAYDRMQYYEGFKAGQKAAQPKWISVEERLPEELGVVLGVLIGTVTLLFYVGEGEFRTGNGMLWEKGCGYISHWMPLPEPPEEGV